MLGLVRFCEMPPKMSSHFCTPPPQIYVYVLSPPMQVRGRAKMYVAFSEARKALILGNVRVHFQVPHTPHCNLHFRRSTPTKRVLILQSLFVFLFCSVDTDAFSPTVFVASWYTCTHCIVVLYPFCDKPPPVNV